MYIYSCGKFWYFEKSNILWYNTFVSSNVEARHDVQFRNVLLTIQVYSVKCTVLVLNIFRIWKQEINWTDIFKSDCSHHSVYIIGTFIMVNYICAHHWLYITKKQTHFKSICTNHGLYMKRTQIHFKSIMCPQLTEHDQDTNVISSY